MSVDLLLEEAKKMKNLEIIQSVDNVFSFFLEKVLELKRGETWEKFLRGGGGGEVDYQKLENPKFPRESYVKKKCIISIY